MERMKAAALNRTAGIEGIEIFEIPRPAPASGELLVKVHAAAVTPTELGWFPTFKKQSGEPRPFPVVLGHEFSGVVAELGKGVTDFKLGEAVFGLNDWFGNGALAEYCVAPAAFVASKPPSLDDVSMSVAPISALTAWQGLFDRAKLKSGDRVLIHGGAGAVGVFAVQLAVWRGAYVIATASTANVEFVRSLGAREVIDYKTQRFDDIARDIDILFDTVGGETLRRSWGLLKPGGRAVTVASNEEKDVGAKEAFFIVEANRAQLDQIARLIESQTIRPFVEAVFPLAQAREAFTKAGRGGMRGKVSVKIVP